MNRKITRLAFGAKWGSFGASGSVEAARARPAPRPANASAPNPQALSCRNRRRLRNSTETSLVDVPELGGREERVEDRGPRGVGLADGAQVPLRKGRFPFRGASAQGQMPDPVDPRPVVR